jgi:hypothetical protein
LGRNFVALYGYKDTEGGHDNGPLLLGKEVSRFKAVPLRNLIGRK